MGDDTKREKSPAASNANLPVKKFTVEETKQVIINSVKPLGDMEAGLKKLGEEIIPNHSGNDKKKKEAALADFQKIIHPLAYGLEFETQTALMHGFDENYRIMAKELTKQLIAEYKCETSGEKMLVEIVVNSFIRTLDNSKKLNNCIAAAEYLSDERTRYLAMMSKQIDRSHRQYLSGLMMLKQLKAPPIEMTIKAKNAFVSQNQQINAGSQSYENNEPK